MTNDCGVEFRMDADRRRRFALYNGIDRFDHPDSCVSSDLVEMHARNISFWITERPDTSSLSNEKMCIFHIWVTHLLVESTHAISREIPDLESLIMRRVDELLLTDKAPAPKRRF